MRVTFNGVGTDIIALNCQLKGSILFMFIKMVLEHILHFPFSRSSCSLNRKSLSHGVSGATVLIFSNLTCSYKSLPYLCHHLLDKKNMQGNLDIKERLRIKFKLRCERG